MAVLKPSSVPANTPDPLPLTHSHAPPPAFLLLLISISDPLPPLPCAATMPLRILTFSPGLLAVAWPESTGRIPPFGNKCRCEH